MKIRLKSGFVEWLKSWGLIGGIIGGCAVIVAIATVFVLRRRFE